MNLAKQYKECWGFLKENLNYVITAFFIFVFFGLVGFIFPVFFEKEISVLIEKMVAMFDGVGLLETILKIFLNNLKASSLMILFGGVLGLLPLIAAISNGYILGFVARRAVSSEGIFILWKLFPHGIFELPAVILSIGIGLKLGVDILKKDGWKFFKKDFLKAMKFFLFVVVPLLIVAGIIEGVLVWGLG